MPIKLERLSQYGRRPVINNAKYFDTDWIPAEEDYYICQAGDISMYNHPKFEGGGTAIGLICKEVVEQLYPGKKFNNLMEWASGPSYIGFLFLGTGMCDKLTCADIYRPALRAVEKTMENMPEKYAGKIDWFHIRGVADIPEHKKFDLIIGSPPHWNINDHPFVNQVLYNDRRSADPDWLVHQEFFANIKKNLTNDGVILLQEQAYACGPKTFEKYIKEAGLTIKDVWFEPEDMQNNLHCYYLEIVHA